MYLDEEMAGILDALSRQKDTTVSELVRGSLRECYMPARELNKGALARGLTGIWKDRRDLKDIEVAVRKLRTGSRRRRSRIG